MKIRFVAGPDGFVYYDPSGKAAGDFVLVDLEDVKDVISSKSLEQSLPAKMSDDFVGFMTNQLINRFKTNLSLAKKAGVVVTGTPKVLEGLKSGKVRKVLLAEDAGADIRKKLKAYAHQYTCLLHTNVYDEALNGSNIVLIGITHPAKATPLFETIEILSRLQ